MSVIIQGIKVNIAVPAEDIKGFAAKRLRIPSERFKIERIVKESLDAREKPLLFHVFSLEISGCPSGKDSDAWLISRCKKAGVRFTKEIPEPFRPEKIIGRDRILPDVDRPVIAGFGPCGMFAALVLAKMGLRPIVLERGGCMEERVAAVEAFWNGGELDPECNVQFGEGGAGTFSDGKLTTGTKSPYAQWILEQFTEAGAPQEILFKQKPHIGTDVLRTAVVAIRKKIEALGGEILFNCRLEEFHTENGKLRAVSARKKNGEIFSIKTCALVLALGHSARDTVRTLYAKGLVMEQKPFSIGVRIEHPQALIDMAQYGALHEELGIGAADYKLNVKTSGSRGVYTFCMCPGGFVVNSSSFPGMLTTNGMSNSDRASGTANSALLADVLPSDYAPKYLPEGTDPSHPLAGMAFQEKYERLAFELGGGDYRAPAQTVGDFLRMQSAPHSGSNASCADLSNSNSNGTNLSNSAIHKAAISDNASYGTAPSFRPGTRAADLRKCLPDFAADAIAEALPLMGQKLQGFDSPDAVMTAIESRSSSPVRIKRDPNTLQALACCTQPAASACTQPITTAGTQPAFSDAAIIKGLYPAGEGAGYAGGIMSAAADGVRIAVKISERFQESPQQP